MLDEISLPQPQTLTSPAPQSQVSQLQVSQLPSSESCATKHSARNNGAAVWFLAALAAVVLAGVLQTGSGRQVLIPWVQTPLPETCTLRLQLGIDCPGCGLTRGFIHAAHGRLGEATAVHPLSLPLFGLALLQLPLALAHWIPIEHRLVQLATRYNMVCMLVLAALMLLRWIWLVAN